MIKKEKESGKILTETEKDNKDAFLRGVKTQKKSSFVVLIISIILALAAGGGIGAGITAAVKNSQSGLSEEYRLVKEKLYSDWLFKDKYPDQMEEVFENLMVNGSLSKYNDPYTAYAKTTEDLGLVSSWSGVYGFSSVPYYGTISASNKTYGGLRITYIQDGSFNKAGGKIGDVIIGVRQNGEDNITYFDSYAPSALSALMQPKIEKTSVTFFVIRDGELKEITCGLDDADKIPVIILDEDVADKTLVLRIDSFYGDSTSAAHDMVKSYIDSFLNEAGHIDKLIIDCKDNGGGYTNDGFLTASLFADSGDVIYTNRDYYGNILATHKQSGSRYGTDSISNIGIIVNSHSASATELFTNGVKENNRCKVYGTKSYGKGIEQGISTIYGSGNVYGVLKITGDYVFTPAGNCIHGIGISPDLLTAAGTNDYYTYIDSLVSTPYQEDSYRLSYNQEQEVLNSIKKLSGYQDQSNYQTAVTEFQKNSGIAETGIYDSSTLYRLYGDLYSLYYQGQETEINLAIQDL